MRVVDFHKYSELWYFVHIIDSWVLIINLYFLINEKSRQLFAGMQFKKVINQGESYKSLRISIFFFLYLKKRIAYSFFPPSKIGTLSLMKIETNN